jgi:hypothetical protein
LPATLAPAVEDLLQARKVLDTGQQLELAAPSLGGSQADDIELAGVVHPGRAVERTLGFGPPPQPDVLLTGT